MLARVQSYGLQGIKGYEVTVEIDINNGLPGVEMVGLPDAAIKEAKERVKSAIKNSGLLFSPKKITINLAPADTRKEGPLYDLPMAMGILSATEQLEGSMDGMIIVGELSLDGRIRHVKGALPIIIAARAAGYKRIVIPKANAGEAAFIDGIDAYALSTLKEAVEFVQSPETFAPVPKKDPGEIGMAAVYGEDFKFVRGQYAAKRALEVAAAGGHNILMIGPPGGGKTMLAKCLPSILPDMTVSEALETTKIHSVAGVLDEGEGIVLRRPFRSPHHTTSRIALTGGGASARPGEISLAHNGVLFLDELLEYPRATLEILRQPLEDSVVTIARAMRTVEYPAGFMLVASMNPCPCGYYGSSLHDCSCTETQIQKYRARLSAPLMDRIDLHIEVDNVTYDDLAGGEDGESSAEIKQRVDRARSIQLDRFKGTSIYCNARMTHAMMPKYCALSNKGEALLRTAFEKFKLSARAYNRVLKVARTAADLEGSEVIEPRHITEAVGYRSLDRSRL